MSTKSVVLFVEEDGAVPVKDWLDDQPRKVQDKFVARVQQLAEEGHRLRRPLAAHLGDQIYELRVRHQNVHYRILYFFSGDYIVLSHGLTREKRVPPADIKRAKRRRDRFAPRNNVYRP
ncbi:MAG: type II toxin-antitoxin system RelE/ParE family toxin [Planctomycetota bacterium]